MCAPARPSETERIATRRASDDEHLRRDAPTSAPGRAHICAGTRPHLRRDAPTSAPGLAHICAGTRPHLRRDLQVRTAAGGAAHPQQHAHAAAVARWVRGLQPPERASARGSEGDGRSVGQPAFADAFGFRMLCALIGAPWVQRPVSREDRERLAVAAAARAARDHRVLGPDAGE